MAAFIEDIGDAGQRWRRRYRWPRRLQLYGAVGLVAYALFSTLAAFAISGPSTHPSREVFPFFTWSLFSRVNDVRTEYQILVLALDDQRFAEPIDMREIEDLPFGDSRALGYKALRNLGNALRLDKPQVSAQRAIFESRYLGRHDVDYLVVLHKYNPLRRWREGPGSGNSRFIGRYTYKGRS